MTLPSDYDARKALPIYSGVLKYFPDAIAAVAHCSKIGNDQHNPGQPLHWAREKSTDEHNTCVRHLLEAGTFDTDGVRHSAKAAWRALAALQKEIEADGGALFDPNYIPPVLQTSLAAAVETARNLSPQGVLSISIDAGIHNQDGSLTDRYKPPVEFRSVTTHYARVEPVVRSEVRSHIVRPESFSAEVARELAAEDLGPEPARCGVVRNCALHLHAWPCVLDKGHQKEGEGTHRDRDGDRFHA